MKAFISFVLAALFCAQFTNASENEQISGHFRMHSTQPMTLEESDIKTKPISLKESKIFHKLENKSKHDEFMLFSFDEVFDIAVNTVKGLKLFLNEKIEEVKKSDFKLPNELKELEDFSKAVDDVTKDDTAEYYEKIFELFYKSLYISDKYDLDKMENPTEEQKAMGKLFEGTNFDVLKLQYLVRFSRVRQHLILRFKIYMNSLTPTEKLQESKLIKWMEKLKKEEDFVKVVEIELEILELL